MNVRRPVNNPVTKMLLAEPNKNAMKNDKIPTSRPSMTRAPNRAPRLPGWLAYPYPTCGYPG
jgi:hypothetical protein